MNTKKLGTLSLLAGMCLYGLSASANEAWADSVTVAPSATGSAAMDSLLATMADSLTSLDVVTVRAQKPLIKMEADKVAYDVQSDPDSKTDNTLEMLRKVPYVTVDGEDNIQVNGSSKFKVYINGKPNNMVTNNPKEVLQSMPASSIQKIEVLTNPGARYDAEGVTGILNIVTVGRMSGYMINFNGIVANNAQGGGVYATVQKGKFTTTMRYNYIHDEGFTTRSRQERTAFDSEDNYYLLNEGSSNGRTNMHMGGIEASYEIDTLRLLTVSGDMFFLNNHSLSENSSNMWGREIDPLTGRRPHTYSYRNAGMNRSQSTYINASIDYQRTFKRNKDELLTLSYYLSSSPSENRYENRYDTIPTGRPLEETILASLQNLRSTNENSSWEHTFQADYVNPITDMHEIETGLKYIIRRNGSDGRYYSADLDKDNYEYDAERSSQYDHNQDILAAYLSYRLTWNRFTATVGGRYEHTFQKMKYHQENHPDFSVGFDDVVPSVLFTYKINDGSNMRLGYNMRISRPGISFLDPYVDRNTPGYLSFGNPDLDTEKSHSLNLSYSYFSAKIFMGLSAYYTFVNNSIESYSYLQNDTLCTTYANIGKSRSTGLSGYVNYSPFRGTRIFGNASLTYSDYESPEMNLRNHGFTYQVFGGLQQQMPWGLRAGLFMGGSGGGISLQGKSDGYFWNSLTLTKELLEKRLNLTLGLNGIFNPYQTSGSRQETTEFLAVSSSRTYQFRVGLRVSYRLGELKATVKKARRGVSNDDVKSSDEGAQESNSDAPSSGI
ncbi:MAG: TonB-dependent receptor domain-containing protein [Bacteroidaceae bacterium]|jgi:outer membrane receptor protein involved in Fe transport